MSSAQLRKDERGASAVEFALTMPVFLLILLGIIQVGWLLWTQFGLQQGVQMAARCASVNPSICSNEAAIQSFAARQTVGLSVAPSTFSVSTPPCGNQVSASYQFTWLASIFGLPPVTLTAQSCFPK